MHPTTTATDRRHLRHGRSSRAAAATLAAALLLSACGSDGDTTADVAAETGRAVLQPDVVGPGIADAPDAPDAADVADGDGEATSDEMADASVTGEAAGADAVSIEPERAAAVDPDIRFDPTVDPDEPAALVNGFVEAVTDPLSTFALDVDTASFTQTLAWLEAGQRPPASVVRPEEFVNWPDHGYEPPDGDTGWSVTLDGLAAAPWAEDRALLRVGLRTATIPDEARPPATLVFVVDTSGSMSGQPLRTVKDTLLLLVDQLRPDDRIGLVEYGSTARLLLEPTALREAVTVTDAIERLETDGATNAEEGLALGYDVATRTLLPGHATSVVLASDGVANVGATGPDAILATIGAGTELGIQLLALGVSEQGYDDHLMEQLSNRGNGSTFYVRDARDAKRLFVDQLTETLVVTAEQSKVQVEVDPSRVRSYRLVGYENRAVADRDFRNDEVDAGEVGAGHEVTAVYELVLVPGVAPEDVLGTVRLRWEDPTTTVVAKIEEPILATALAASDAPPGLTTAIAATALAEVLRGSPHVTWTPEELATWAGGVEGVGIDPVVADAIRLAAVASPAPGS